MPAGGLSELEKLILDAVQERFPVCPRPFQALAERLSSERGAGLTEESLIEALKSLKERGYLRRLGAIFNSRPLGYSSTLCAAEVPEDRLEAFGKAVSACPQVTHNYVRNNQLNVWFTFCFREEGEFSDFLAKIKKETQVTRIFELSALKIFKIRAVFKLS